MNHFVSGDQVNANRLYVGFAAPSTIFVLCSFLRWPLTTVCDERVAAFKHKIVYTYKYIIPPLTQQHV